MGDSVEDVLRARLRALENAVRAQRSIEAEHIRRWDNSQGVSVESYDEWKASVRKVTALLALSPYSVAPVGKAEEGSISG